MIPKKHRFTRRDFVFLRPKMKKFRSGDFLFFYKPTRHSTKLAAVVSKKVSKKAVLRNQWRRRVYDYVGPELIKSQHPMALVCLYKGAFIPQNTHDLATAWTDFKTYAQKKNLLKYTPHE